MYDAVMASDFETELNQLTDSLGDCDWKLNPDNTEPNQTEENLLTFVLAQKRSQSVCVADAFSTLSLVETIENNLRRRQSTGTIKDGNGEEMGSSASKKCLVSPVIEEQDRFELDQRPQSVEVCGDPGLEEAEGISHAQLVTRINSTFDDGFTVETGESITESISFASILDEFKPPAAKTTQGKFQKSQSRPTSRGRTSNSAMNLTLTGMKAKQIDRSSQPLTTPRAATSRGRPNRQRNPNAMKSLEERLYPTQKTCTRKLSDRNQNSQEKFISTVGKNRKAPRRVNILAAIKPSNVEEEKQRFFASSYSVNPVFVYRYPANEAALARYDNASSLYLEEVRKLMCNR